MGRKSLHKKMMNVRVSVETPGRLKQIAHKLGFTYAGEGATGALLDAIASAEVAKLDGHFVLLIAGTQNSCDTLSK